MTTLRIRDVSLFVKVLGQGDPLLLMHGGPGLDHTTLDTLEPLADRFTVILYDHRANGRSTGATETMTFDNLVADAEALRETLGHERWSVAGHSFGGPGQGHHGPLPVCRHRRSRTDPDRDRVIKLDAECTPQADESSTARRVPVAMLASSVQLLLSRARTIPLFGVQRSVAAHYIMRDSTRQP